jgi:uncharacterized membrane protein YraQ (UPF0718 family)
VALGLRRSGCSVGASLAFWLGNPILNPATMIFMGFVLGWRWVGLRLIVGVLLVFVVAYLVQWLVHGNPSVASTQAIAGGSDAWPIDTPAFKGIWKRFVKELWRLSIGLIPEYVVLVLILGAARTWLFPAVTPGATGLLWTIGLAGAGMLFVIPTAGEIPIVQTLMAYGLGVGPAGALLTTLPPVSLPSLAMVAKVFPLKIVVAIPTTVVALGVFSGAQRSY